MRDLKADRDKIKYLKRYRLLDQEIDRKVAEVMRWRSRLEKITSVLTTEPKGGGSIYPKEGSIIAKIVDLENDINADIDRLIELKKNIENVIVAVVNDQERLLLKYRYLDGQKFEWIAAEMNYSWRQIHYIHVRGLKKMNMENVCT